MWDNPPDWLDGVEIPKRLHKTLAHFTPHRDGWCIWYKGASRFVCGKRTPLDEIEGKWDAKRAKIDADIEAGAEHAKAASGPTFAQVVSHFFAFNDERVRTGKPKAMRPVTAWDYQRTLGRFLKAAGAEKPFRQFGPGPCADFAATLADETPGRFTVHVAYVEAFVRWAMQFGYFADNPHLKSIPHGVDPVRHVLGPALVKPPEEDRRDHRIGQTKRYAPDQLRELWKAARREEKVWIALGLNGAFDNADLAHLAVEVIDFDAGTIDFRRRKRGRVRRVVPLLPRTARLLKAWLKVRPKPADPDHAALVFLTPNGHPLQRLTPGGQVDYVAAKWGKLLARAGLRGTPKTVRDPETGQRRQVRDESCRGDGRGFRGLRTSFANLAPPGFREEVEIVMGHAHGTVLLDDYLEDHGISRLRELVDAVWRSSLSAPPGAAPRDGAAAPGRGRARR